MGRQHDVVGIDRGTEDIYFGKNFITVTSLDQTAFLYDQAQLRLPGVSSQLKDFYEAEVVRLREKMTNQGLLQTFGSLDVVIGIKTLNLVIPDITASSGAIRIFADQQAGKGTLTAPSDPSITITNKTNAYLTTSKLTIPDHNGGVFFNGQLKSERTATPKILVENVAIVTKDSGRP